MISQLEKGEEPWLMKREVSGGPSPGKSKAGGALMFKEKPLKSPPGCGEGCSHLGETHKKLYYHSVPPFLHVPLLVSFSGVRGKEMPFSSGLTAFTISSDLTFMVFLLSPAF